MFLKIIEKEKFKIEVTEYDGKIYFGAIQVATALGYINPRDAIIRHCRDEGVTIHDILTAGGKQKMKFIDEGNVYRLIVRSKLPEAEKFEQWVFDEVLPTIRKHHIYATEDTIDKILSDPDLGIKILTKVKEEQEKRKLLENKLEVDKLYTNFAKDIEISKGNLTLGEYAKIISNSGIEIGRNRLFEWLREAGYLIKRGRDRNIPKQQYIEQGLFVLKEVVILTPVGQVIKVSPRITGKGQLYIYEKLKEVYDVR
ncbi:MAG: hypothetical protein A2Y24_06770 [Clostridiales bacterium GWE2_32_10]|nr:MAG: hypothetical protein A2Y24_06770 [Clostridiales bacterium GWE2_32_10]HBY20997.1 phage repressor protein/antirepressor Ant [Clostridiales bacterium]